MRKRLEYTIILRALFHGLDVITFGAVASLRGSYLVMEYLGISPDLSPSELLVRGFFRRLGLFPPNASGTP